MPPVTLAPIAPPPIPVEQSKKEEVKVEKENPYSFPLVPGVHQPTGSFGGSKKEEEVKTVSVGDAVIKMAETPAKIDEVPKILDVQVEKRDAPKVLESVLRAKERELNELKIRERDLGAKVEKFYGMSPEEIVAKGGIGLRGLAKRILDIGAGENVFGKWRDQCRRSHRDLVSRGHRIQSHHIRTNHRGGAGGI